MQQLLASVACFCKHRLVSHRHRACFRTLRVRSCCGAKNVCNFRTVTPHRETVFGLVRHLAVETRVVVENVRARSRPYAAGRERSGLMYTVRDPSRAARRARPCWYISGARSSTKLYSSKKLKRRKSLRETKRLFERRKNEGYRIHVQSSRL